MLNKLIKLNERIDMFDAYKTNLNKHNEIEIITTNHLNHFTNIIINHIIDFCKTEHLSFCFRDNKILID